MLRSVRMMHIRVQIPNRDAVAATRAIAAEGLLHLVDIAHGRPPYDASPPGTRELYAAFRDLNARVAAVAARLGVQLPEPTGALRREETSDFAAERERIELVLQPIEKETDALVRALAAAREADEQQRRIDANTGRMQRAGIDPSRLELRFAALRLGIAPPDALESLAGMLAPAPFAIVPLAQEGPNVFFAAACANFARPRLDEAFKLLSVMECGSKAAALTPAAQPRESLEAVRAKHEETLRDLARRTELATLLLQAQTFFASAGRFVVVSGWVPADAAERLEQRIRAATGGRAIIDLAPAEAFPGVAEGTLRVPILHRNPLLLRPFQKLIDLYGTPSYGEVEPTAFFAISFLLMFGLMFGDVGHGGVLFAAGWFLFRYMPRFLDYGILLMEAGAASTLFGFLYGSVFGLHGIVPTLWLEPIDDLSRFMAVAIALGVIVVSSGLVINIVNCWRTRDFRTALLGPKGVTGAVLYWIVIVILARAFVPGTERVPDAAIYALLAAAIAAIVAARFVVRRLESKRERHAVHATPWWLGALEGSIELVDTLFSFFANTISFVRVAAFAAVHAGVFIAIFALADTIAGASILVHIAGNIVMVLLEGLTVSVQVLRLEYYEFFGKFFRGGGETYKPLALDEEVRHVS